MGNFQGKFDLLKLENACVISVNGKSGAKEGVFIPIEDNDLFVSADGNNKAKRVYLNFIVFETKQISKFGDTHIIKRSLNKEMSVKMSDEEKHTMPILGNMKPLETNNTKHQEEPPTTYVSREEEADSLPF